MYSCLSKLTSRFLHVSPWPFLALISLITLLCYIRPVCLSFSISYCTCSFKDGEEGEEKTRKAFWLINLVETTIPFLTIILERKHLDHFFQLCFYGGQGRLFNAMATWFLHHSACFSFTPSRCCRNPPPLCY